MSDLSGGSYAGTRAPARVSTATLSLLNLFGRN
jgi:hypothetical protein